MGFFEVSGGADLALSARFLAYVALSNMRRVMCGISLSRFALGRVVPDSGDAVMSPACRANGS